ncbi:MAG: tautomerase family protein [Candidatus Altiarchaeota archaeon]
MPIVRIELVRGRSTLERRAIMDAVRRTIAESLKVPDESITQRMYVLDRECFDIPPGRSDKYVLIEVTMFPGRSKEAKKKMYSAIVECLGRETGIDQLDVFIVVKEPPLPNWGIRGGKPADEADLGYELKV